LSEAQKCKVASGIGRSSYLLDVLCNAWVSPLRIHLNSTAMSCQVSCTSMLQVTGGLTRAAHGINDACLGQLASAHAAQQLGPIVRATIPATAQQQPQACTRSKEGMALTTSRATFACALFLLTVPPNPKGSTAATGHAAVAVICPSVRSLLQIIPGQPTRLLNVIITTALQGHQHRQLACGTILQAAHILCTCPIHVS